MGKFFVLADINLAVNRQPLNTRTYLDHCIEEAFAMTNYTMLVTN